MNIARKIKALNELGNYILSGDKRLEQAVADTYAYNKWFTTDNVSHALHAIARKLLNAANLEKWLSDYKLPMQSNPVKVGIIMAGNIPLAGFHDFLSVLVSGNIAMVKLSSKDKHLLPFLTEKLIELEAGFKEQVQFVEKLKNFDAVIATGSDNSSRYFDYYFGKYPHIFRKNRNSVAVLTGSESITDLLRLGDDIFLYFGLGCRNVSKLYVPAKYDFAKLLDALRPFETLTVHNGYKNNYDYNLTLLIMNKVPYYASDFLMLRESESPASPIATLFYEYYDSLDEVKSKVQLKRDELQCIVGSSEIPSAVNFGESQSPELWDYADEVDTLKFLFSLQMVHV